MSDTKNLNLKIPYKESTQIPEVKPDKRTANKKAADVWYRASGREQILPDATETCFTYTLLQPSNMPMLSPLKDGINVKSNSPVEPVMSKIPDTIISNNQNLKWKKVDDKEKQRWRLFWKALVCHACRNNFKKKFNIQRCEDLGKNILKDMCWSGWTSRENSPVHPLKS
ncbi:hypothetical protein MAR_021028 [Mya arenaria]|uniref:Uncharacterized protein n=1 Tax=Mya arenaria TaxID=6604 RepID=A0ABY7EB64_MYAAR|nr:hypothetical protein MAR_021028 [Mya arenaria]